MQSTHHRTLVELKLWQSFTDYALLARRHRHQFISTCICEDSKRIFDFAFIFRVIPILAPLSRTTLEHIAALLIVCHAALFDLIVQVALRRVAPGTPASSEDPVRVLVPISAMSGGRLPWHRVERGNRGPHRTHERLHAGYCPASP